MVPGGTATEVYRRGNLVITVTGIPAVFICPQCENAVIEWETAQQIEELVQPILQWADSHTMPSPAVAIAFPQHALSPSIA